MKMLELDATGLHTPVATTFVNSKNGNIYYQLKKGLKFNGFKQFKLAFSAKYFKPSSLEDTLTLDSDDYVIMPVKKNGRYVTAYNEKVYTTILDNTKSHKRDILLFWEVPNDGYEHLDYSYRGDVKLVGQALSGVDREGPVCETPTVILDIYGSCELTWKAIKGNTTYSQTITYTRQPIWEKESTNEWYISDIKIKGV